MKRSNLEQLRDNGILAANTGNLGMAITCFEKVLELTPDPSSKDFSNAGLARRKNGQPNLAKNHFESAIKRNPSNLDAAKNLVLCMLDSDESNKAIIFLKEINKQHRDSELRQLEFKTRLHYRSPLSAVETLDSYFKYHSPNQTEVELLLQGLKLIPTLVTMPTTDVCKAHNNMIRMMPSKLDNLSSLIDIITATTGIQTLQTQIFFGSEADLGCNKHFSVFNATRVIPKYCFSCLKVQVDFASMDDLFAATQNLIQREFLKQYIQKAMIELRYSAGSRYKIFAYARTEGSARQIYESYKDQLIPGVTNIEIKRGCSEFSEVYPNYKLVPSDAKSMQFPAEWSKTDKKYYPEPFTSIVGRPRDTKLTLSDILIYKNWLAFKHKFESIQTMGLTEREINSLKVFRRNFSISKNDGS